MNQECKINIDLDKTIIDFCVENVEKKINIEEYVERIVKSIAKNEKLYFDEIAVSITSATKDEIKKINKEYREIDKATDVLSFPIFTKDELNNLKEQESEKKIKEVELGDIIICLDVVKVQAV